jgi:hypothetical protein
MCFEYKTNGQQDTAATAAVLLAETGLLFCSLHWHRQLEMLLQHITFSLCHTSLLLG